MRQTLDSYWSWNLVLPILYTNKWHLTQEWRTRFGLLWFKGTRWPFQSWVWEQSMTTTWAAASDGLSADRMMHAVSWNGLNRRFPPVLFWLAFHYATSGHSGGQVFVVLCDLHWIFSSKNPWRHLPVFNQWGWILKVWKILKNFVWGIGALNSWVVLGQNNQKYTPGLMSPDKGLAHVTTWQLMWMTHAYSNMCTFYVSYQ